MCFSATASFSAAAILATCSLVGQRYAPTLPKKIFIATPFLFAIQQMIEGFVWIGLRHEIGWLTTIGTYSFLFFAAVFWPIWIPLVVGVLEPHLGRTYSILHCWLIGILTGTVIGVHLLIYGAHASISDHHIAYNMYASSYLYWPALFFYCIATIAPFFFSTRNYFWIGGTAIMISYFASFFRYYYAQGSVWCFFAAIISSLSLAYLFLDKKDEV